MNGHAKRPPAEGSNRSSVPLDEVTQAMGEDEARERYEDILNRLETLEYIVTTSYGWPRPASAIDPEPQVTYYGAGPSPPWATRFARLGILGGIFSAIFILVEVLS